ncbi:DUF559 domain-containing protein [Paucihalobacter ruber]|uniref:DUF559 domain-containing protein n=1 Tax=Paucihalobacter ruber TaxID=2567861 RepID=A0A506PKK9_9FLAO|nr:DUF559 domain-containing protein [Paucihalobacter ruber]TPV33845.1 DUF559 domain-containing protein [Paucihalobacter ruber]
MKHNPLHTRKYLKPYRKKLRESMTPAEAFLWRHLKSRQLCNRRFNRQFSIGNYIADFYCHSEKLIIELDGEIHNTPETQAYDDKRTAYLESHGYRVIRFENKMVFDDLVGVLEEIRASFNSP